jgi:hypothetical protein
MNFHHRKHIFRQIVVTKWVSATGNAFCGHMKNSLILIMKYFWFPDNQMDSLHWNPIFGETVVTKRVANHIQKSYYEQPTTTNNNQRIPQSFTLSYSLLLSVSRSLSPSNILYLIFVYKICFNPWNSFRGQAKKSKNKNDYDMFLVFCLKNGVPQPETQFLVKSWRPKLVSTTGNTFCGYTKKKQA